jgi:Zn-dependent protease
MHPPNNGELRCAHCGTQLGPRILACPSCRRLVFADTLNEIAQRADATEAVGNYAEAQQLWRNALLLLPSNSPQRTAIDAKLARIQARLTGLSAGDPADPNKPAAAAPGWAKWLGGAAPVILFVLTKWKLLLLGLTKLPTMLSMLAAFGVYWSMWGWKFALGFLVSLYIHEMGHVFALRYYNIPASVPLFLPGFGAVVFSHKIVSPAQDSRVGLAGPLAGFLPVLGLWIVYSVSSDQLSMGIAYFVALVNYINLLPFWSLDGDRGLRGLTRQQRWYLAGFTLLASAALDHLAPFFTGLCDCDPDVRDEG